MTKVEEVERPASRWRWSYRLGRLRGQQGSGTNRGDRDLRREGRERGGDNRVGDGGKGSGGEGRGKEE